MLWPKNEVVAENGMVTSLHPQATMAGVEILKKGGNAVDAAVATSLAVGVTLPMMSGLGGRNFGVIYMHGDGKTMSIEANVISGSKTRSDTFEPISAMAPEGWPRVKDDANTIGYKAICVPGNIACLSLLLEKWGTMDWKDVTQPAIRIAEEGYTVYQVLSSSQRRVYGFVKEVS